MPKNVVSFLFQGTFFFAVKTTEAKSGLKTQQGQMINVPSPHSMLWYRSVSCGEERPHTQEQNYVIKSFYFGPQKRQVRTCWDQTRKTDEVFSQDSCHCFLMEWRKRHSPEGRLATVILATLVPVAIISCKIRFELTWSVLDFHCFFSVSFSEIR